MARSYVMGLPVTATVEDDGSVTWEVDLGDIRDAMFDSPSENLEDFDLDLATVSEAAEDRGHTLRIL